MGFIQRANETAEYLATNEKNTLGSSEDNLNFPTGSEMANQQPISAVPDEIEKKPPTASVQVQAPSVPTVAPNAEEVNSASISTSEPVQQTVPEEQDDSDVLEDPTAPQPLEGRLAGLEPVIGSPQMTLGEAVGAGMIINKGSCTNYIASKGVVKMFMYGGHSNFHVAFLRQQWLIRYVTTNHIVVKSDFYQRVGSL